MAHIRRYIPPMKWQNPTLWNDLGLCCSNGNDYIFPSPKTLQKLKQIHYNSLLIPICLTKKSQFKKYYINNYILHPYDSITYCWISGTMLSSPPISTIFPPIFPSAPWHIPSFGRTAGPTGPVHRTSLDKRPVRCRMSGFFGRGRGLKGNALHGFS